MDGDFMQFLGELPPIVPLLFIGFALIFIVGLVMVARPKGGNTSKRRKPERPSKRAVYDLDSAPVGDLPELDLLLGNAPGLSNEPVPAPRSEPPGPRPAPTPISAPVNGPLDSAAEVMTILRGDDNRLLVRIDGQLYSATVPITDAGMRKSFSGTIRELVKLATDMPTPPKAPPAPPKPIPEPAASAPAMPTAEPHKPAEPKPAASTPPAARTGEVPGDLPMFRQMASEPLKFRGGKPKQAVPEIAVGSAIEAYLQYRLQHAPDFTERSIHVHNAVGGGVTIEVDGRFYDAVRDVEDEAVRDFLTTTIEEWQNRQ